MITENQLKAIPGVSAANAAKMVAPINAAMERYQINTPARVCAFLGQVLEESGHLQYLHELWGPTAAQGNYEYPHPKATELGNTTAGDGMRYKGRGLIQCTGRSNYRACGTALGIDVENNPALLEEPGNAALSAGWFWDKNGLNAIADQIDFSKPLAPGTPNYQAFEKITRRINGGTTHIDLRVKNYNDTKAAVFGHS